MVVNKYVIQRRYQTELAKKVGGALGKMFQHIEGDSLHINEEISVIEALKPLTKRDRNRICTHLLQKTREDGDKETMSFECVPYSESIRGRAAK